MGKYDDIGRTPPARGRPTQDDEEQVEMSIHELRARNPVPRPRTIEEHIADIRQAVAEARNSGERIRTDIPSGQNGVRLRPQQQQIQGDYRIDELRRQAFNATLSRRVTIDAPRSEDTANPTNLQANPFRHYDPVPRRNNRNSVTTRIVIPKPQPHTGVYGRNYTEAKGIVRDYWRPPTHSNELPVSDIERQYIVLRLREALRNVVGIKDNASNKNLVSRFGPNARHPFSTWEYDRIAWEILATMEELEKYGFIFPVFDHGLSKRVDRNLTFRQRLEAVVSLFSQWKSICSTVMKGEKISSYVAGPLSYNKRSGDNLKNNCQRKQQLDAGKQTMEQRRARERERALEQARQSLQQSMPRFLSLYPVSDAESEDSNEHSDTDGDLFDAAASPSDLLDDSEPVSPTTGDPVLPLAPPPKKRRRSLSGSA